jgi:pyocin large subunit-like protein
VTVVFRRGWAVAPRVAAAWLWLGLALAALGLVACGTTPAAPSAVAEGAGNPRAARIARDATWAAGQLQAHFAEHGREGPYPTVEAYDASARETIRIGKEFGYVDRTTHARRRGFYDPPTNRFTGMTEDGRRITTHFRPDSGEHYVRGLLESTYR